MDLMNIMDAAPISFDPRYQERGNPVIFIMGPVVPQLSEESEHCVSAISPRPHSGFIGFTFPDLFKKRFEILISNCDVE